MEKIKKVTKQLYYHPFLRYLAIGGTTFMIDFFSLVLLHGSLRINLLIATSISYWCSIAFNFIANRTWTFGATDTHMAKHLAAYSILLACNFFFTILFVGGVTHLGVHYTIAKILSVVIQTGWTYIAYKKFIFR